jgi:hypothetical protein
MAAANSTPLRVAVYTRVSTAGKANRGSLAIRKASQITFGA